MFCEDRRASSRSSSPPSPVSRSPTLRWAWPARPRGRIAFSDGNQIFIANATGKGLADATDRRTVTAGPYTARPDLSRDGQLIVYDQGGSDIWSVTWDGKNARALTGTPEFDTRAAWSPNRSKVAFVRALDDFLRAADVWVMDANGANAHNLTADVSAQALNPTWSPDGTTVAYDMSGDIFTQPAAGGPRTNVTATAYPASELNPSWGPTGRIAYQRDGEIYTISGTGGTAVNVTNSSSTEISPAWSPDGTRLTFVMSGAVYTMGSDGTSVTFVAPGLSPSWGRFAMSPTPTPCAGVTEADAPADCTPPEPVSLVGIEVTQVSQDLRNSVPLYAGKRTWVRLYFDSKDEREVAVKLTGVREDGSTFVAEPWNAPAKAQEEVLDDRGRIESSLNFDITRHVRRKQLTLTVAGVGIALQCREYDTTGEPNDCKMLVNFRPDPGQLAVDLVPILYRRAGAPVEPTPAELEEVEELVRDTFPAANIRFGRQPRIDMAAIPHAIGIASRVEVHRAKSGATRAKWVGVAIGPPPKEYDGTYVWGWGNSDWSSASVYLDRPQPFGLNRYAAAHELGHVLYQPHPRKSAGGLGWCNEESRDSDPVFPYTSTTSDGTRWAIGPSGPKDAMVYGLNTRIVLAEPTLAIADPEYQFELMSDCVGLESQKAWVWPSSHTYKRIAGRIASPPPPPQGATTDSTSATAPHVLVTGRVDAAQRATIESVRFLPLVPQSPPTPGTHVLRLVGSGGQTLSRTSFAPALDSIVKPQYGAFVVAVPNPGSVTRIEVRKDGALSSAASATRARPRVTLAAPNGGAVTGPTTVVSWTGSDDDGTALTYDVQFSPDNGVTWATLAGDVRGTQLSVPTRELRGTATGRFRVVASDGFWTAIDASDGAVSVPNSPPSAMIVTPFGGEVYQASHLIAFEGASTDREAELPPSAYTWTSDRNGLLGTGPLLRRRASTLVNGPHLLTLTVKDASGATARDSARFTVSGGTAPTPTPKPPERRIVFASNRDAPGQFDLYSMKPDGTGVLRLTSDVAGDEDPDVSRDGRTIVWSRFYGGYASIWRMNADGTDKRRLTPYGFHATEPALSPDGTRVLYTRNAADVMVMDTDGTGAKAVVGGPTNDSQAVWSPAGARVVYVQVDTSGSHLFIVNADGTNRRQLTTGISDKHPSWGYGTRILFTGLGGSDYPNIWSVPPEGGTPTRITALLNGGTGNAAWSPGLDSIVFTAYALDNDLDVFTMNASGGDLRNLTNLSARDQDPAWGG